jgi:hypothetical protein
LGYCWGVTDDESPVAVEYFPASQRLHLKILEAPVLQVGHCFQLQSSQTPNTQETHLNNFGLYVYARRHVGMHMDPEENAHLNLLNRFLLNKRCTLLGLLLLLRQQNPNFNDE